MSQPHSIAAGIAIFLGMALVKPTIGVASVVISPLNPRRPRKRPVISSLERDAGMSVLLLSASLFISFTYAG